LSEKKLEEATMKKRWTLTGLGFLLVAFFAAAPVRGDDVDQRIKSLEDELARLKSEQTQVKAEQIQLRKQATAAEAALPNFSYRPGSGMLIEAADKAWSFRASLEAHFRLLFESGETEAGREMGGVMGRRFRTEFYYCVNDCFYEIAARLDLDGFGTGNGKNSTNTATSSMLQRAQLSFNLGKLNPWLPRLYTGMDGEGALSSYRQGSSSTGSQLEYDLLSRNNGFNTGRWGNGFGLDWDDVDLFGVGRIPLMNVIYATIGEGDDGLQSFREQRSISAYINVEPFARIKNKWIQGIGLEFGAWFCPNKPGVDNLAGAASTKVTQDIACSELRIRDNGDGGRQDLYRVQDIGSGLARFMMPGFAWTVGPYRLRAVGGFQRYDKDSDGALQNPRPKANMFLIGHDLYIWSPKGFLTGSATAPGSILLGTHFERTDASCGTLDCVTGGQFKRNRILLREWDVWYVLMNRMSVGAAVLWYDASNVRSAANGNANNVQQNLGCVKGAGTPGKGCDWVDVSVTWRYQF
jgi:hypothetical protein